MSPAPRQWSNLLPERLADELRLAEQFGVRPAQPGSPGFDRMLAEGTGRIKWVVMTGGDLLAIPFETKGFELAHTVASSGQDVLAAGEAGTAGHYFGLEITHHSGHYEPDGTCLEIARLAFRVFGIEFPA